MKLLIVTQKVNKNDPILGFFHAWLFEFSKSLEKLTVICLEKGEYDLPENVEVLSLGKEAGVGKFGRLVRLHRYVYQKRKNYDKVLVHMNPIYLVVSGICWKFLGKEMYLWYMHKSVDWKLRLGIKFVKKVFSATPESFRLPTRKLVITGHGIDTELFKSVENKKEVGKKILTISRISRSKRIDALLNAMSILPEVSLDVVGGPVTEDDKEYFESLKKQVENLNIGDRVNWLGEFPNSEIVGFYQDSDVFVNVSETGSLDKAILEALACGIPVVSSNDSAATLEGVYRTSSEQKPLAHAISLALENGTVKEAREMVIKEHGLDRLIKLLIKEIYE